MKTIEVKKVGDRCLARRYDQKPLTSEDRQEAKRLISILREGHEYKARWVMQEDRKGFLFLRYEDHRRRGKGDVVLDADELKAIMAKSDEEIRLIAICKRTFPGCRVVR